MTPPADIRFPNENELTANRKRSGKLGILQFHRSRIGRATCCRAAAKCHYTLDANPDADGDARERLTLAISTADVVVTGARRTLLLEPLQQHRLASVAAMDAHYANARAPKPWVPKIVIVRLDKSNGAAG